MLLNPILAGFSLFNGNGITIPKKSSQNQFYAAYFLINPSHIS